MNNMKPIADLSREQRGPRLPANDRVIISDFSGMTWTINWSPTGACVMSDERIRCGERVRVEFPERYVRGEATVVWTQDFPDGCLAGLEFQDLDRRAIPAR